MRAHLLAEHIDWLAREDHLPPGPLRDWGGSAFILEALKFEFVTGGFTSDEVCDWAWRQIQSGYSLMPYPKVYLEIADSPEALTVLAEHIPAREAAGGRLWGVGHGWKHGSIIAVLLAHRKTARVRGYGERWSIIQPIGEAFHHSMFDGHHATREEDIELCRVTHQCLIGLLGLLGLQKSPPRLVPAPVKLNHRRIALGKLPLFSYRIVDVPAAKAEAIRLAQAGPPRGSPRLHLRRGHLRTYRSGRTIEIRPCIVGDKKRGLVMHDYHVESKGPAVVGGPKPSTAGFARSSAERPP